MDPQLRSTALTEAGKLHRFFLGWRQASFVGFVIAVYNVVAFCIGAWPDRTKAGLMLLAAAPLGLLLAIFEDRTRGLYYLVTSAAKGIENPAEEMPPLLPKGMTVPRFVFAALNVKPSQVPRGKLGPHSLWLVVSYVIYSAAFLITAIVFLSVPS